MKTNTPHLKAVLQAVFVTFLWSTSWVLIKFGLQASLPPVTFAGLRYTLAFLCLLPFVLFDSRHRRIVRSLSRPSWTQLIVLGLVFYTITQGAQFVGLAYLPAATLTLVLNLSPILIAFLSSFSAHEPPSTMQWIGILISAAGVLVYFLPLSIPAGQTIGLIAALVCVLANSIASLFGRRINSQSGLHPLVVTTVSMGVGGLVMLVVGGSVQGLGVIAPREWLIIGWLAIANTAFAFLLWNRSLGTLTAVESGIINGLMLPQIAILAWLFLDEPLSIRQVAGLVLVGSGTLAVQLWRYLPVRSRTVNAGQEHPRS